MGFEMLKSLAGNNVDLPSEEMLKTLSFRTSLNRSTNKLSIDEDILRVVEADAQSYKAVVETSEYLDRFLCRVKTPDSIRRKIERRQGANFQSVFNDLLGIRIEVDSYDIEIPEYYRVVDMREGKSNNDGYRAMHLYYKLDNFHYIIEVQLWSKEDYKFNLWSHTYGYKSVEQYILLELRERYDLGYINSYDEYIKEMSKLCQK